MLETFAPELVRRAFDEISGSSDEARRELDQSPPDFVRALGELLVVSPPMRDWLRGHPEWIRWLRDHVTDPAGGHGAELTFSDLDSLREFKRRDYIHILFRDLAGMDSFRQTVERLSGLADLVIASTLSLCWNQLAADRPDTLSRATTPEGFAVFALGKLGGRELNYSSDVDLIFCRRASDSEQETRYYTRLGERLVQALSSPGPEGFLYRVDMRLRPHGETGPLVPTIHNLVNYYESWGEAWERQALIKTRFVAGCRQIGDRFRRFVETFTFSRQMDDSSLEEIKRVKFRSEKEHATAGGRINLKQGPGGIRDVEFYVQYLQLVAGSAHPECRSGCTLDALEGLARARVLLDGEQSQLALAYIFLRIAEHRLQLHSLTPEAVLPSQPKELDLLARSLGFRGTEDFCATLARYRRNVRATLERIYLTPGQLRLNPREEEFARLLSERTPREKVRELLGPYGFEDPDRAWQNIRLLALGPAGRLLPPGERRAFLEFVFPLLEVLRDSLDPDQALNNLESFASATGNRISFLRALASRRPHLTRLANLLAVSNRSHQILIRHPEYFDSLARGVFLHEGRNWVGMLTEIRERMGSSPKGEGRDIMLRRYRQREMVRIAYRDLAGLGDAVAISGELSELAEACVQAAIGLTYAPRLGFTGREADRLRGVGLGKLGSRQMHYGSDLDLIFVYEPGAEGLSPEGRAGVQLEYDGRVEKILDLVASVTAEGIAYQIDLRLRPEGASGLLARTWESFLDYSRNYMQPWERMALVRSRMLGNEEDERWNALVWEVTYGFPWDDAAFESIRHLKRRIEAEKNKESRTYLDFKYGKGGIADLEFLVQSLQLRYGARDAAVRAPGMVAAIPALRDAGALSAPEADELLAAHKFQRRVENRYQLLEEWSSREISRESPKLIRLARSLGYKADPPAAARRAFLADWEETSRSVRRLVERYFYEI